jgi:hypothetical protein
MFTIILTIICLLGTLGLHLVGYGDLGNYCLITYFGIQFFIKFEDIENKLKK